MTQTDIRALFMAGLLPGLMGVLLYLFAVRWTVWRNPAAGPAGARLPLAQQIQALSGVWPMILLFVLVIGGIYVGIFTPTESAGVGAFGAMLFALGRRRLDLRSFVSVVIDTAATTAALFMVLIGALIFANFVNATGLPQALTEWVTSAGFSPYVVLLMIVAVYLVLGCVLESMSMLLLTIPVFSALVGSLDFGLGPAETLIWFGIVVVVATEISLITPPIGMNVFTLSAMLPDVRTGTIFRGVTPFWFADLVRLALLIALPGVALLIPSLM
jgi:tripartite ATP-independent transporter DctM subunit